MINFYETEDFTRTVFTIEDSEVVEHTLSDLCEDYADETTTPHGVMPRFHVRDNELWDWGFDGHHPRQVYVFDTEEEAEHALNLVHKYDLYTGDNNPIVYDNRAEAESALRDLLADEVEELPDQSQWKRFDGVDWPKLLGLEAGEKEA